MNDLDRKLRDYYESQSLSGEEVDRILQSGGMVRRPLWSRPGWWAVGAAAGVVIFAVAAALWFGSHRSLESRVAAEVVKNHTKQLDPEVWSSDFAEIQAALPRLGFPLAPTRPELLAGLKILGGRYCSLQDQLAAQINLLDPEGKPCTLYIVPLTETLARVSPGVYRSNGNVVQVWRDAHRLYAMAQ